MSNPDPPKPPETDSVLELHRQHCDLLWEATHLAMARARDDGSDDPFGVYLVGARAYLVTCWDVRELARLFLSGDGPPGFDAAMRAGFSDWVRRSGAVLRSADSRPGNRALPLVLRCYSAETPTASLARSAMWVCAAFTTFVRFLCISSKCSGLFLSL